MLEWDCGGRNRCRELWKRDAGMGLGGGMGVGDWGEKGARRRKGGGTVGEGIGVGDCRERVGQKGMGLWGKEWVYWDCG